MARLIDILRAPGWRVQMPFFVAPEYERVWEAMAARLHPMIMDPDLPVVLNDNVNRYYSESDQEYYDAKDDFPNLAPPWPAAWFEHKLSHHLYSKEKGHTDIGALGLGKDACMGVLMHGLTREQFSAGSEGLPDNVKWVLWFELYIDYGIRGHYPTGPNGSIFLAIDEHGALVDRPWMQGFASIENTELMKSLMVWLNPTLLTISFLHCKNVRVDDNRMPEPLAKKHRARYGVSPAAYKTLVIEPLRQILRTEGRSGELGLAKAMHICRGHFRDYREGRGLFGKYHGQFWIPSIVRGSKGKAPPPRELR